MGRVGRLRELEPWRDARLRCGIGHEYSGRVRKVERERFDMDGESLWSGGEHEYDPDHCVVCGLMTWTEA
jgi:hypothetical protein